MKCRTGMTLVVILAASLCVTSIALAQPPATSPRIFYSGMCQYDDMGGGLPITHKVGVDTIIVLSNPNNVSISNIQIYLFDKDGTLIRDQDMIEKLVGGTSPTDTCPPNGWLFITIGHLINNAIIGGYSVEDNTMNKYNFLITWDKPLDLQGPYRHMMCEVKQAIYESPVTIVPFQPWGTWGSLQTWSEAALGGKKTTGLYKK